MNPTERRKRRFNPTAEQCEARLVMSASGFQFKPDTHILRQKGGAAHPFRPNTPVLPFGNTTSQASFIDPSAKVVSPKTITIAKSVYVAPYALINGSKGFIKIGSNSAILDNASVTANPSGGGDGTAGVTIGEHVGIGFGAQVSGPSTIGGFGTSSALTYIGPNAVVNSATIAAGAMVGPLAKIDPGITIPANTYVLPGKHITTEAEATDASLGYVRAVTSADKSYVSSLLSDTSLLAPGYANVYQGQSASGASGSGIITNPNTALDNGNLTTIEGVSPEPGSTVVSFEPSKRSPTFLNDVKQPFQALFYAFPARVIGGVVFSQMPAKVEHRLGRHDSIRADEGQPITIGPLGQIGNDVTIHSVGGTATATTGTNPTGKMSIGSGLQAGNNVALLGAAGYVSSIGNNVTVGDGAVVDRSVIGNDVTIGAGSYIFGSTVAAGTVYAPGSIVINNVLVGTVQP